MRDTVWGGGGGGGGGGGYGEPQAMVNNHLARMVIVYRSNRKRTVASRITIRLRGSYAEDRGSVPGRFGVFFLFFTYVVHIYM